MRYWWVNQNQTYKHELGGYESPKPTEFGDAGLNWEAIGWRLRVRFTNPINRIRPKEHIELLRPLLPSRYSPLQPSGNGLQSVYLASLPDMLAEALVAVIGAEAVAVEHIHADLTMTATERRQAKRTGNRPARAETSIR